MPVNLPLVLGSTSPTALAAPVALGMMLHAAARPPRQSWRPRGAERGREGVRGEEGNGDEQGDNCKHQAK